MSMQSIPAVPINMMNAVDMIPGLIFLFFLHAQTRVITNATATIPVQMKHDMPSGVKRAKQYTHKVQTNRAGALVSYIFLSNIPAAAIAAIIISAKANMLELYHNQYKVTHEFELILA